METVLLIIGLVKSFGPNILDLLVVIGVIDKKTADQIKALIGAGAVSGVLKMRHKETTDKDIEEILLADPILKKKHGKKED